jgi:hypothetical protein
MFMSELTGQDAVGWRVLHIDLQKTVTFSHQTVQTALYFI